MITLEVREVPPSPNVVKREYRTPHAYKRLRESWEWLLLGSIGPHDRIMLIEQALGGGRLTVQITMHHVGQYDEDNLQGAQKVVLDALTNIHFLAGDSPDKLKLLPATQVKCVKRDVKTVIEIGADE